MLGLGRKKDVYDVLYGRGASLAREEFTAAAVAPQAVPPPPIESVYEQPAAASSSQLAGWQYKWDDGEKFTGGFGPTQLLTADYWTLRARSTQLFETNLYARGLIRRLVTNVVNTGLFLEATPEESLLGFEEDGLADWSEDVEIRFGLWANDPKLCDFSERQTFGAMQAEAYREALIAGDVLAVLSQDQRTKLPRLRLISGSKIQTPFDAPSRPGTRIVHGVELDSSDRQIAYWVTQDDGTSKRLPAWGEKSGRRLAMLVYASDKRLDDVRGKPLLALCLQSLKEIDRYRDAIQRKAVINSILAMFIKREVAGTPSKSITSAAVRSGQQLTVDTEGEQRSFKTAEFNPGLIIEQLKAGETPEAFQSNGTTEEFGTFEEAIIQTVAWAHGLPPEILRLSFSSNYSASQAATNELRMQLEPWRCDWGSSFCQPVYVEFLVSSVLADKVKAKGLLEAWRDSNQWDTFAAWCASDWNGQIKPAIDLLKLIKAYAEAIKQGLCTRARACRELFGLKFSKVAMQLVRENLVLAEANEPLALLEALASSHPATPDAKNAVDNADDGGDEPVDENGDPPAPAKKKGK